MTKKKKKLNLKRLIEAILVVFMLSISLYWFVTGSGKFDKILSKNKQNESPIVEETQTKYELSLVMVGDALINDYLYEDAHKLANNDGYDFKPYLTLIKDKIKDYDLAYYNQETILGGSDIGLSGYPAFNSPYEVGDAMIDAGFNLVSLATNHTLDRGEKAILNSRTYWNNQENVYAFGSYSSFDEKKELESKIFTKNNIKYAILNYTYGTNGVNVPNGKDYLVNLWSDSTGYEQYKSEVKKDIEAIRDKVDILIVAMHWGVEYRHNPTDMQKKTAEFLASQGVDIVIGTHPHVIEPVEYIENTLVFYSLGNFLSSQTSDSCTNYKCNIGLMSSLKIVKDTTDNTITIEDVNNELLYMYHKNYHDYKIIPFSNELIKDHLNNYEDVWEEYTDKIATEDERIKIVPLVS